MSDLLTRNAQERMMHITGKCFDFSLLRAGCGYA
jgi:hypothetical protein